jgi:hypothetical protein
MYDHIWNLHPQHGVPGKKGIRTFLKECKKGLWRWSLVSIRDIPRKVGGAEAGHPWEEEGIPGPGTGPQTEERFQNNRVLRTVGENIRAATRMASEPKNLITQYARTELWKASFAIWVTVPWNTLPTELNNAKMARCSKGCWKRYNK